MNNVLLHSEMKSRFDVVKQYIFYPYRNREREIALQCLCEMSAARHLFGSPEIMYRRRM